VAGILAIAAVAPAAGAPTSPEQQVAERYAPVLMVEPQSRECGPGEAYRPADVDILFGREGVVLRNSAGKVVKSSPTAADVFGLGAGYYLDFPGNPLKPGCGYEKDYRSWNAGREPVVYAHVAGDSEHPGKLAVQYWLYYTFNDAKNKHEGDWEMVQLDFDAPAAAGALSMGPYQVDLSQHAGGERSAWIDHRLRKDGTHPLIFVATGSHANYLGTALYLGRSPHEGFGCDNTRRATERLTLQTVTLPSQMPSSPSSPYAWLAFLGRWGQRLRGINNGPTGPSAKEQWIHPIEWADGLRRGSVTVPGTKTLGPTLTNFFCDAVTQTSAAVTWGLLNPLPFILLLVAVPFACVVPARRTTWRPPDPYPVRGRRNGGQILRASLRLYARHRRTFVTLGLIFIPVGALTAAVQWVLFHLTGLGSLVELDGRRGAVTVLFTVMIGDIGIALATVVATAAVAVVLNEMARDRRASLGQAIRATSQRLRPLAAATALQYGVVLLLTLTVVGIPLAIYCFIRWALFAQACVVNGLDGRASLAHSLRLVRGRWWRTFGFTVFVDVLTVLSGLIFGIVLLLVTSRSLNFIDIASSLVYTLTVPLGAIAVTLYYFDLESRAEAGVHPEQVSIVGIEPDAETAL
jgi:hypothetical protein